MNQPPSSTALSSIVTVPLKLMEFYGIDYSEFLAEIGLTQEYLSDPDNRVSFEDASKIWHKAQELIEDPCAGLNAVNIWHPSTLGALGYAMLVSTTLRTSLQRVVRYQQTVAETSDITLTETDKGMRLRQNAEFHQSGEFPMLVDAGLSTWLHICRFNYGDVLDPVEVNLKRPKPDCAGRYLALFRCPVNFSATENSITLPLDTMDKPLPSGNRHLAQMNDRVLQSYLKKQRQGQLTTQVRELIISHLPSGEVSKDEVASTLNLSSRTLQRKLQDEDTSFADILNETRHELAIRYIHDDSLPLIEVSYLLGFSDSAAFSRAFKRWTGKTPSGARPVG